LGPTPADQPVAFSVSLRLPGAADLETYLANLSDPGSPEYHAYLRPEQFGVRFGLPDAEIDRVAGWLEAGGLAVTRFPQRTSFAVAGTAGQIDRLLGVKLVDRLTPTGVRYHQPQGTPIIPTDLTTDVATFIGLDSEPALQPSFSGISGTDVPGNGLLPDVVAKAYEIQALHDAGLNGEGQTVALVSLDTFTDSDVDLFDSRTGLSGPAVQRVRLPDALDKPAGQTGEVALDIQILRGIAPKAQIISYEGSTAFGSFGPIVRQVVADGLAKIVSISWGLCEKYYPADKRAAEEQEFAAAFAAGLTIFVASGDYGAYDCRALELTSGPRDRDLGASARWPASSPSVVAVGGTYLSVREDGSYLSEYGWEDPLSGGGTGGGLSHFYGQPAWQQGAGVTNSDSNGKRQLPDVAGPGDPASGFFIEYTDQNGDLVAGPVGGTSAATPFFAGSMVLTQQLAQREGIAFATPLGPVLYQLAAEQPGGSVFHDVLSGGNLLEQAAPGWDYATGLGSPRVAPLARAIVDFLAR
jgi:kumamolisin